MAKGWESKSVEEQQSVAVQMATAQDDRERLSQERAQKLRQLHSLEMNRARVVQQMEITTNDRYKGMLQQELDFLQREIRKLDGSGR
ncbi:MAG: hypothetical protein ACM3JB_09720 [Acidobacteriaceae bacterium]